MKYMTGHRWRNYVLGRIQDEKDKTTSILHGWVGTYLRESVSRIQTLKDLKMEQQSNTGERENERIDILLKRWIQIRALCEDALKAISS